MNMYFFTTYCVIKLVMSIKRLTDVAFQARSNVLKQFQSIRRYQGYTTESVV